MIDLFGGIVPEKKKKKRTIKDTIREAKKARQCVSCIHWHQMKNLIYGLCKVHLYGKYAGGIIYKYDEKCKEKGFKAAELIRVQDNLRALYKHIEENK
mgnify:CR=1 FL=1